MRIPLFIGAVLAVLAGTFFSVNAAPVRLPVSFHRQEHSLSCELATLKMALAAHGIEVAESELLDKLPFDPTVKRSGVWGDPNKGFVGNIDGRMLVTGYGVHWDPIAKLGSQYADTEVIRHGSASQLARHISNGDPVIIWGYYGQRKVYSWSTPDGTPVKAVNGEHTMVVYGFDGTVEIPTRFYLMDPLKGSLLWSTDELMHNWSGLGHMGVVVSAKQKWVRAPGETQVWEINRDRNIRRLITSWDAFIRRGGYPSAIRDIDKASLDAYTIGSPIN